MADIKTAVIRGQHKNPKSEQPAGDPVSNTPIRHHQRRSPPSPSPHPHHDPNDYDASSTTHPTPNGQYNPLHHWYRWSSHLYHP